MEDNTIATIKEALQQYLVVAYLFGSVARGDVTRLSDVDIGATRTVTTMR